MEKAASRKAKAEHARIQRAIRLIRKEAISRAGKALESKGPGDFSSEAVLQQLRAKYLARGKEIARDTFDYKLEEPLKLKLEKVLRRLDLNAAP